MIRFLTCTCLFAVMLLPCLTMAVPLVIHGGGGEAGLDRQTGRIVFLRGRGNAMSLAQTSANGDLWALHLRGGQDIRAADFLHDKPLQVVQSGPDDVRLVYASAQAGTVTVRVTGTAAGIDWRLSAQNLPDDVLDAAVPADLSFDMRRLRRVLFPEHLGIALNPLFFQPHAQAASWDSISVDADGLRRVANVACRMDPLDAAPVPVHATALGRQVLGPDLAAQWESAPRVVNRPSLPDPDVPLLTSGAGAYLGGHRVGAGLLMRFGGPVRGDEERLATASAQHILAALVQSPAALGMTPAPGRSHLVLIALPHGPAHPDFGSLTLPGLTITTADSPQALRTALADPGTRAVINPYGESFPAGDDADSMLDAIHGFLTGGGVWLETGGYSFYYGLRANPYVRLEDHYPSRAFSDFGRIETASGAVSLYGVQNAHDIKHIFVPAAWRTFGDGAGGHLQRRWQTFLPKAGGETPPVRLRMADNDAAASLRVYAAGNGLDRPLSAKMSPQVLRTWKRSVLFKLAVGNAQEEMTLLDHLPTPGIAHLVAYLHGGFDRQYPDHLPPRPEYGTPAQFGQVVALAHQKGFLVMPYTNTTWWPDNPKGPTFVQAGEAPLLAGLDGQHHHEVYGPGSSGWTISPYHPAVVASLNHVVSQFTQDYPMDILFMDQNGARGMMYDLNSASPTPYAPTQGLMDMAARAAARLPVGTEDGFDGLLNTESLFCGLTQELVRFPYDHDLLLSDRLPDADWEFFPMAQYVAHDKAFFTHHDLGSGVWDRDALLWTLALGYGLSRSVGTQDASDPKTMDWLSYLASVQQTLGPAYMGAPLRSFHYLGGGGSRGVMEAVYGPMRVVVNLTDQPYRDGAAVIAPHDFRAQAGRAVMTLPPGVP